MAQRFQADEIPDKRFVESIYTHNLAALSQLAGLQPQIQKETANEEFAANWETVKNWNEKARYEIIDEARAGSMVDAVLGKNGILPWLQKIW